MRREVFNRVQMDVIDVPKGLPSRRSEDGPSSSDLGPALNRGCIRGFLSYQKPNETPEVIPTLHLHLLCLQGRGLWRCNNDMTIARENQDLASGTACLLAVALFWNVCDWRIQTMVLNSAHHAGACSPENLSRRTSNPFHTPSQLPSPKRHHLQALVGCDQRLLDGQAALSQHDSFVSVILHFVELSAIFA
jgi:hypothetical protein